MMTRYYFHVRSADDTVSDEEGDELPDFEAAHRQALASARELLANAIKVGRDPVPDSIVIADASGREMMIVFLQDVLPSCFRKSREILPLTPASVSVAPPPLKAHRSASSA